MVPPHWREAWPRHVWIGTTVEDQRRAEERIPHLLDVPAAVRFLSCEPLLSDVDLSRLDIFNNERWPKSLAGEPATYYNALRGEGLRPSQFGVSIETHGPSVQWVIVGGESGPDARPFDLAWARSIVAQCREAGVAVFVKQMGAIPVEGLDVTGNFRKHPQTGKRQMEMSFTHRYRYADRAGADSAEWPTDLRVQQFPGGAS